MLSLISTACLIPALLVLSSAQSYVQLEPDTTVKRASDAQVVREGLGVVYGTRSCGGAGKLVQWRIEDCHTTDSPCRYPVDNITRHGQLEFIPSADIQQLGVRIVYTFEDGIPQTVYEMAVENSSVVAGVQHVISTSGHVRKDIKGKRLTVQEILYRIDNGETEICAEAEFEME